MLGLVDFFSKPQENLPRYIAASYLKSIDKPSDKWSLNNKIIQLVFGKTEDARTYNQWQAVNRRVKKGEKAFYILAPNSFKVAQEDKNGEIEEKTVLAGFRGIAVFADNQTSGEQIKYVEEPNELPPLFDVAKKMGLKIKYDRTTQGEGGSYNQVTDEIRLCDADMGTFFHELAHAVHKRVDGKLKGGQDIDQETIAEFTSCIIAAVYGYDKKSNAYNYIKSYAQDKKKVGEQIIKVLSKVQKILDYIFK
jgi:antirestriction protein ArdC